MDDIEWLNEILAEHNIPPILPNHRHETNDDSDFIAVLKQQIQPQPVIN